MQYSTPYIDTSLVSPAAVVDFIAACEAAKADVRCYTLYRDNKLALRIQTPPHSFEDKAQVYSASKSFTSTAIGFAIQEGLLTVDMPVISFFEGYLPDTISDNLRAMTVKHLLSMNTGHETEPHIFDEEDSIAAFLAHEVPHTPGTHFLYNTAATYMLSAILQKLTGITLIDYLTPRLFVPLAIDGASCGMTKQGICAGGFGFYISCDDLAKLGLLYLNKGVWNGQRLLSEAWVAEASSAVSDNSANNPNPDSDWAAGYGYQFWRNAHGKGFRGDGAVGQYCLVRDDCDAVMALTSEVADMQVVLTAMQALIDDERRGGVCDDANTLVRVKTMHDVADLPDGFVGTYRFAPNDMGVTMLSIRRCREGRRTIVLTINNGCWMQEIRVGAGEWKVNTLSNLNGMTPSMNLPGTPPERFAACYGVTDGKLTMYWRYLSNPHQQYHTWSIDGDALAIEVKGSLSLGGNPVIHHFKATRV